MPKAKTIILAIALVAVAAAASAYAYVVLFDYTVTELSIDNNTDEYIEAGEVTLCGEKVSFSRVAPGTGIDRQLKVIWNCSYQVNVTLKSGKRITGKAGLVERGKYYSHVLGITGEKITVVPRGRPTTTNCLVKPPPAESADSKTDSNGDEP